jgi:hypothetical protein
MPGKDLVRYTESEPRIPSPPGFIRTGLHQFQTWSEERWNEAEVRRLQSQTRLIQAQQELAEAEYRALRAVHTIAAGAEEAASERSFHRTLRAVDPREAHRILRIAVEEETALLQREQIRRYRLGEGAINLPIGLDRESPSSGGMEVDLSARQVESLALRAVTQFQSLPVAERESAFTRWKEELEAKFPAFAVAEILRKAEELRGLL